MKVPNGAISTGGNTDNGDNLAMTKQHMQSLLKTRKSEVCKRELGRNGNYCGQSFRFKWHRDTGYYIALLSEEAGTHASHIA